MDTSKDELFKLRKTVYNRGYIGIGIHKPYINSKTANKSYRAWINLLTRCYNKKLHKKHITYVNCTVCEEWLNYQVFAEWFEDNYIEKYHLDKDILIKGNKIYSPETCCFVPSDINRLILKCDKVRGILPIGVCKVINSDKYEAHVQLDGKYKALGKFDTILEAFNAYKIAKENEIKRKANQYKDTISEACYLALINYNVEITD